MLKLKKVLEKNSSYINSWNTLSKSIIIKENLERYNSILIIIEDKKSIKEYKDILSFLNIPLYNIDNSDGIINYLLNCNWLYIIESYKLQKKIDKYNLEKKIIKFEKDIDINIDNTINYLVEGWYEFSEYDKAWSYKKTWDILTINCFDNIRQYKISLWWDRIEEIKEYIYLNEKIIKENNIDKLCLSSNRNFQNEKWINLIEIIKKDESFKILESLDFIRDYEDIIKNLDNFCSFDFIWNKDLNIKDLWVKEINIDNLEEFKNVLIQTNTNIITKNKHIIDNFINYNNIKNIQLFETKINNLKSFSSSDKENIICDDIISKIFIKKRIKRKLSQEIDLLLKISIWDYVVHIDHWIWRFNWIIKKELNNIEKEYLEIEYLDNWKLFVPITEVSRVNKYLWVENPKLTSLNTKEWEKKIKKASEDARLIAEELLEIYSKREIWKSEAFINYEERQKDFKNSFKYTYTEDQENAIDDIFNDLDIEKPSDRLLVWDVWFGKTEVAFNAIFKTFLNKKQSIFISPLVVLAYEHFEKAKERFWEFNLKIEVLTRLESDKKTKEVIKRLENWEIDLVIWTHKLLSNKIIYKSLWLLVVDEEHKFWVKDKEKIKKMKANLNVLSMSATPIPRSLNMALSNLRDISIIKTPPFWRQSINTTIGKYSENIIYEACKKEFERKGQVFFIHNRVMNIEHYKKLLESLFPKKKVVITHGRLEWIELERRIIDFKNKKYDILLSTTVIENWIDFSNVNTIIINDAPNFWISQIHQLRWRVWRSDKKWYCYLLYKNDNLNEETIKRLKTIVDYSYLWAWFELAMKDLEIRWWWDILGIRQSGQTSAIWINLFLKMIEEKIEELKSNKEKERGISIKMPPDIQTKIDLNIDIWIPEEYFSWELDKINYYREIETIESLEEINKIIEDFRETFWKDIPQKTKNLFNILKLKIYTQSYYIKNIKKVWLYYHIEFYENISLDNLKNFLSIDKEVIFTVINISKLKANWARFKNDERFMDYMINLFEDKFIQKSKLKIKLSK